MTDDAELLRCYAEEKSDEAFGELVRRHIDFVYAAALRQARGNAPLAQDVTQSVFTDLARKSSQLARHEVVVGWLHTATRFAVAKAIRSESRRIAREQEAFAMNEARHESGAPIDWERLHPVLDAVLGELKERERAAILLRFFEKLPLAEVGAKLALTESAARSCVDRALEKMHVLLARRGVTSTAAALGVALANQVGVAAPAGLAASVTGAVLGAPTAGWLALFMGMTKIQLGGAGALTVAVTTALFVQENTNAGLRRDLAALAAQPHAAAALRAENQQLASVAAEVEVLRRDDLELKQLEQRVADLKKAAAETARVAQNRVQDQRRQFEEKIQADQARAQEEVDRMNREASTLLGEYRVLAAQANDPALAADARASAATALPAKLEVLRRKRTEIRVFSENVSKALSQRIEAFRRVVGDDPNYPLPAPQIRSGRTEARREPGEPAPKP
jgi:RNA polymerase sigma factor (sigma-70 family)